MDWKAVEGQGQVWNLDVPCGVHDMGGYFHGMKLDEAVNAMARLILNEAQVLNLLKASRTGVGVSRVPKMHSRLIYGRLGYGVVCRDGGMEPTGAYWRKTSCTDQSSVFMDRPLTTYSVWGGEGGCIPSPGPEAGGRKT